MVPYGPVMVSITCVQCLKVDPAQLDGVKPDDIAGKLSEVLAPNFMTNTEDLIKSLAKEHAFVPYGTLVHSFSIKHGEFDNIV